MFKPNIAKMTKVGLLLTLATIAAIIILTVQRQATNNVTWPRPKNDTAHMLTSKVDDQININISAYKHGGWRHLSEQQIQKLSKLGRILYLDEPYPATETNKSFTILLWKYGMALHSRHMQKFSEKKFDPFKMCSVKNCKVTYADKELDTADLVIFHMQGMRGLKDIPKHNRTATQIWAWYTDEGPYRTTPSGDNLPVYNGLFNWSMHYRTDSDIPVPYGRTVLKTNIDYNYKFDFYKWILSKKHDVLIAIMGSNCNAENHRWEYVAELKKYISVDMYGACGTLKCDGHYNEDCPAIDVYMFYLAFENCNCDGYISEKVWWNAYAKNSIPIVMGAKKSDYLQQLPPNSYINVDDFLTPRDLASYLQYLINTPSELEQYFKWKKYFEVRNEHGYFLTGSRFYCRACEALNFNDRKTKVFANLTSVWSATEDCYLAWDIPE